MKNKSNKYMMIYVILGIIAISIVYTACKDITPEQNRVEANVELKLSK